MKKEINAKVILLTVIFGFLALFTRVIVINFSLDLIYLHLISPIFTTLFIYFLTVSFSKKQHHLYNALKLVIGIILFKIIIYYGEYDDYFILRIIGLLIGLIILCITYIDKINRWLIDQ
jgi:hypothetical protein